MVSLSNHEASHRCGADHFMVRQAHHEVVSQTPCFACQDRPMSHPLPRRRLLATGAALLATPLLANAGIAADAYPAKPIKLVLGFAPGGITDILARIVAQHLAATL